MKTSALTILTQYLATHGPIGLVRVSSAQAKGAAKRYAYWGAVRYMLHLTADGVPTFAPEERASSDRRTIEGAQKDAEQIANTEGRIYIGQSSVGRLTEMDAQCWIGFCRVNAAKLTPSGESGPGARYYVEQELFDYAVRTSLLFPVAA